MGECNEKFGVLYCNHVNHYFVCGCSGDKIETYEGHETESKIKIGLSFDSFVIERWQRDRDVFVYTAEELDAEVNVQNANGDVDKQISQISTLLIRKWM